MSPQPTAEPLYPIREVARLTGVNAVTLRAWERRHGLIQPQRTPKGHRLYSRGDIARIERILQWLGRGVSVSQVGDLLDQPPSASVPAPAAGDWPAQRQQLIAAAEALDLARLETLFNQSLALYPVTVSLQEVWLPVIARLEERWRAPTGSALARHMLATFLRTRIGTRLYHANLGIRGPQLLLAPLPGNADPLWLLLFGLAASDAGYGVHLLDAPPPHGELPLAVERLHLAGVVLVGDQSERPPLIRHQLPRLARQLPVPLCLAGAVARIHAGEADESRLVLLGDEPLQAVARLRRLLG